MSDPTKPIDFGDLSDVVLKRHILQLVDISTHLLNTGESVVKTNELTEEQKHVMLQDIMAKTEAIRIATVLMEAVIDQKVFHKPPTDTTIQ